MHTHIHRHMRGCVMIGAEPAAMGSQNGDIRNWQLPPKVRCSMGGAHSLKSVVGAGPHSHFGFLLLASRTASRVLLLRLASL